MWQIFFLLVFCSSVSADEFFPKFEYQYSFKGPQLTIDNQVPFWSYGESALPSEDQIRLVPSIRSKKGFVWSQFAFNSKDFEVVVTFKITGRGRVGADGMAVWFTESPGFEGNVYGNRDMWKGLGIFLDSYDNDGKGNNPYISIVSNDGTVSYDHANDGGSQVLAGCQYDFRNKPYPSKLKFQYYNGVIKLWYSSGITQEPEYELCLTHNYADMPPSKFLGLSAATGGLADDHDVLSFLTYTLTPLKEKTKDGQEAEKQRLREEFEKFSETMEERKKTFREENPNQFKNQEDVDFEDVSERQLRLIFDGQHRLFRSLNEIKAKLESSSGSSKPGPGQGADEVRRLQGELSSLSKTINNIYTVASEQKTILREIQSKVSQLSVGKGGDVAPSGAVDGAVKSDISVIKQEVLALKGNLKNVPEECSKYASGEGGSSSCVSNYTFMLFAILQVVLMAIYIYVQRQKEQASKKFF